MVEKTPSGFLFDADAAASASCMQEYLQYGALGPERSNERSRDVVVSVTASQQQRQTERQRRPVDDDHALHASHQSACIHSPLPLVYSLAQHTHNSVATFKLMRGNGAPTRCPLPVDNTHTHAHEFANSSAFGP